jgi:hypothetical protein
MLVMRWQQQQPRMVVRGQTETATIFFVKFRFKKTPEAFYLVGRKCSTDSQVAVQGDGDQDR